MNLNSSQPGSSRPAAIFWDMDGTLTDSEPLWGEATYYLSELLGRRLTPELREKTVGAAFPTTFSICVEHAGYQVQPGDLERFQRLMFDRVKSLFAGGNFLFPGITELLQELHADGLPMLITTNTQREVAAPVFAGIGTQFFVDTICGDEVPAGKPAPDMYEEAARRVGQNPQDCLVFEDSTTGMQAAVAAGCRVIGLPADDSVVVPPGVTRISELHGHSHLAGASAADVYAWWQRLC